MTITAFSLKSQTTTEGTDFWFGFMENIDDPPDAPAFLELSFSAKQDANIMIEGPANGYTSSIVVRVGETIIVQLPVGLFMPKVSGQTNMGIHVTSDVNISVYALNKRALSADAAVILPTNALGNDYIVMSHVEDVSLESQVLVVASEDQTRVEVIPSQDLNNGLPANDPFIITLNKGQTYQLKSNGDLTGTIVRAFSSDETTCKNFAVFGGNKLTFMGNCGANADHLYEQMLPTSTWGKEFLYVPYASRVGGDVLKVVAKEDDTTVEVEGMAAITLQAGEWRLLSNALSGVRNISADKPISLGQFARSQDCDNQFGDPFMVMLSPMEQRITNVTFEAFEAFEIERYYLTLITVEDGFEPVILDGTNVSSSFSFVDGKGHAIIEISRGNHNIVAPSGVIAYVYGFGNIESFGYSAGVSLTNVNLEIELFDPEVTLVNDSACFGNPLTFTASFDTTEDPDRFSEFFWDFGDGNSRNGKEVTHEYAAPGVYEIKLIASDGTGACSTSETILRQVNIEAFEVEGISGPGSVCPEVKGVLYDALVEGATAYQWIVEGGTIQGSNTAATIEVDWGGTNASASIALQVTNELGCTADYTLPINVDLRLEPTSAIGPELLCFTEKEGVRYSISPTNGSEYEWFIEGGNFDGANTGNEVFVSWQGNGRIWYTESNPDITDCSGISPLLEVELLEPLIITPDITDVSCANGNDGSIRLEVIGGMAPYSYQWNADISGEDINVLEDLEAGSYTVVITDDHGCMIEQTFEVEQPIPLMAEVVINNVSCYNGTDGEARAVVSGGTAPYTFSWNGAPLQSSELLTSQEAGTYSLRVTDANDCEFIVSYEINQPTPITVEVSTSATCPGASDGSISLEVNGGTAPYTYNWSTSSVEEGVFIDQLPLGNYSVTITDANNCPHVVDEIEVSEFIPRISVPNAFTPNGDNANEDFTIISQCSLIEFDIKIYNSWGGMVFQSSDQNVPWDGQIEGEPAPTGKYAYRIYFRTRLNGEDYSEVMKGVVRLIR